jgi:hypothetical protein
MALAEELERAPAREDDGADAPSRWRKVGLAALVLVWLTGVALYVSWPLVTHLGDRIPGDLADPLENTWILGWGAHAIVHQPLHLFEGNMFAPQHHTLAYAENMLGLSLPTAPIFWITGNALLQTNVASLLILLSAGLGMFLLVRAVTGEWTAALVAGTAYEVVPYRIGQFGHLHVAGHLVPWALFVLVLMHRRPRWSTAAALAGVVGLQFWSSLTGGFVMLAAVGAWTLWTILAEWRRAWPAVLRIGAGTAVGVMLAVPVFLPYLAVRRDNPEFNHPADEAIGYSATPASYLYAPSQHGPVVDDLYGWLDRRFQDNHGWWEKTLWPGLFAAVGFPVALVAGAVAVRRRPKWWQPLASFSFVSLLAVVMSFGPRAGARADGLPLPFAVITKVVPAGLMRVPARFGVVAAAGAIAAAAVALSALRPRVRMAVAALALLVILGEAMPTALREVTPPPVTAAHRAISRQHGGVLALPTTEYVDDNAQNVIQPSTLLDAQHMYLSTANFRPLINGYGAFAPPSYYEVIVAIQDLPSTKAFTVLKRRDVQTIVVQTAMITTTRWRDVVSRLEAWPGVRRIGTGDGVVVFDVSKAA